MKKIAIHLSTGSKLPVKSTPGSAGWDVFASLPPDIYLEIPSGERIAVPTGLFLEIPHGYVVSLRPRSGLALKHGLTLPNSPATIDSDYRGELKIIMINLGKETVRINHGDRIAQLLLEKVEDFEWEVSDRENFSQTDRGTGGFGSTGIA